MEGYVRGRPRRLAVESLEERALLSSSAPLDYLLASPLPPDHAPLTPAEAGYLASMAPALVALPPAETALLVGKLEVIANGGGAVPRDVGPDHEGAYVESVERGKGEALRAAVLQLAADCATEARVVAEAESGGRAAPFAAPARTAPTEAGPVALAAGAATPTRDGDGRGTGAVLLRGEVGEGAAAPPAPAEPPLEGITSVDDSLGAAPLSPGEPTDVTSLSSQAAALLQGSLPINLPALKREVDEFFARLSDMGDGETGWHACTRFGPWLIVLTAGAFEMARGWRKRSRRRSAPGDEVIVGPVALLTEDE